MPHFKTGHFYKFILISENEVIFFINRIKNDIKKSDIDLCHCLINQSGCFAQ